MSGLRTWCAGLLGLLLISCQAGAPLGLGAYPVPAGRALPTVHANWGPATEQLVRQLVLAAFDRADRNHDRFLDAAEWAPDQVKAWDADKDGRLTTWEWTSAHQVPALAETWRLAAIDYFDRLDADRSKLLSRQEVKGLSAVAAFKAPSEQVYDRLYDRYTGLADGLSARLFPDFVLALAFDAGRFAPLLTPPGWPAK